MRRAWLLALLLGWLGLAWAQSLDIIPLRHRTAEQVLPQLVPLLEPGGALSGSGDKLFLRTSPRNKADLLRVLEAIDTRPRRLLITVRQGSQQEADEQGGEVAGTVNLGRNVRIIQPGMRPRTQPAGPQVEIQRGDHEGGGQVRAGIYETRRSRGENVSQQVQTLEGGRAYINVGQAVALPLTQAVLTPRGVVVSESIVWRDLGTGFYAEPRLVGERVTLEISPSHDTPGAVPGSANIQRLSTTVSGRLGEWIALGGSSRDSAADSSGGNHYGTRNSTDSRQVWLKVDELP